MSSLSNRRSSPGLTPIPWTSTTKNRRLTEVKETNAQNQVVLDETFQYDVNNNLIGEAVNGVPQRWTVYDGSTPYLDLTDTGQVSERYLADPNALAMYWARVGVTGQADWMVTDLLGSVRALVSAGGSVEDQIAYDAYGNVVSETNPSAGGRIKYAGGQYDGGLGLTLFGARWYNSAAGRWLSQDPLGLGPDMNPYRYVGNSPTNAIDPGGLQPQGQGPIQLTQPQPLGRNDNWSQRFPGGMVGFEVSPPPGFRSAWLFIGGAAAARIPRPGYLTFRSRISAQLVLTFNGTFIRAAIRAIAALPTMFHLSPLGRLTPTPTPPQASSTDERDHEQGNVRNAPDLSAPHVGGLGFLGQACGPVPTQIMVPVAIIPPARPGGLATVEVVGPPYLFPYGILIPSGSPYNPNGQRFQPGWRSRGSSPYNPPLSRPPGS
jgi:RHS repeat-associated protein